MTAIRGTARATVAVVAVLIMASACAGTRNSLGTPVSPCFRALPGALTAVHNRGHLVGVRRVNPDALQDRLPPADQLSGGEALCVFAFRGTYAPGSVAGAHNTTTGRYAVVALTSRNSKMVAAYVLDRLFTRFRHVA